MNACSRFPYNLMLKDCTTVLLAKMAVHVIHASVFICMGFVSRFGDSTPEWLFIGKVDSVRDAVDIRSK